MPPISSCGNQESRYETLKHYFFAERSQRYRSCTSIKAKGLSSGCMFHCKQENILQGDMCGDDFHDFFDNYFNNYAAFSLAIDKLEIRVHNWNASLFPPPGWGWIYSFAGLSLIWLIDATSRIKRNWTVKFSEEAARKFIESWKSYYQKLLAIDSNRKVPEVLLHEQLPCYSDLPRAHLSVSQACKSSDRQRRAALTLYFQGVQGIFCLLRYA
jgi:hypothetical protein